MPKSAKFLDAIFNTFKSHSRKGEDSQQQQQQRELGESIASQEQRHFSFERIVAATQDFHPKNMLGRGGFGPVFKGKLEDGREIAVKMLSESSNQGEKEFINEARLLVRVQHRNVVNLVGYCAHAQHKLLIYEYVARESIDKLLFHPEKREQLDWKKRYDIIVGITRGLLYLHEGAHCCIIHRDIKASNILLDDRWVPKIADFGMARLYMEDHTYVKTRLAGTNGYMAPEYVMHGSLSIKADVFSFGILVLEIISGKKISNFISEPDGEGLLEWAWNLYKTNRSLEIIDPKLASTAVTDQVRSCIKIGFLCTERDPRARPTMQRVLVLLSKKPGAFEEPVRPGFLRSRNRDSMGSSSGESSSQAGSSFHHSSTSASASASASALASTARTNTTTSTFTSPRRHHSHSSTSASASASASTARTDTTTSTFASPRRRHSHSRPPVKN